MMTMAKIKDSLRQIIIELERQGNIVDSIAKEHYVIKDLLLEVKNNYSSNTNGIQPRKPGRPPNAVTKSEPTGSESNIPG